MPEQCVSILQACAVRIARLAADGSPVVGADDMVVVDDMTTVSMTPQVAEGQVVEQRTTCDSVCLRYQACDVLTGVNLELDFCKFNPYAAELLGGGSLLTVGEGETLRVGYAFDDLNSTTCPNGVSIEVWARRVDSTNAQDPDWPWLWIAIPRAYLRPGAWAFPSNAIKANPFSGRAVENPNWGNGPGNDWPTTSTQVVQVIPTDTLPTATCGWTTTVAS